MIATEHNGNRVLELAGDGSRTESLRIAEEQAAQKLHAALPANPRAGIRPMEAVWALAAFVLFSAHLEKSDVSHKVVQERYAQEGCVAQFGPGEYHRNPKFRCAPMVEAPNYVLTRPIP
jgi:hypothetical protein